jgi:hypothetical protein
VTQCRPSVQTPEQQKKGNALERQGQRPREREREKRETEKETDALRVTETQNEENTDPDREGNIDSELREMVTERERWGRAKTQRERNRDPEGDRDPERELQVPVPPAQPALHADPPHLAVSSGEHPVLVHQHATTVELISVEQGHLPRVGALFTWVTINNPVPTPVILTWMETWKPSG